MAYKTKINLNNGIFSSFNRKVKGVIKSKKSRFTKNTNNLTGWKKRFESLKASKKFKGKKFKKILYSTIILFMVVGSIGLLGVFGYVRSITADLPSRDKPFGTRAAASEILDRNGKPLYRMYGKENTDELNIEEIPDLLIWSFLAAEDMDFYKHPGIDVSGIARCSLRYIRDRYASCGGSTITQQLIKLTALTNEKKLERKVKEIVLALQIEKERDKDEIIEMYLRISPQGSNIYGIKTAAKFYFGKELSELNLAEMAVLASIPQNPNRLSPTVSSNPENSRKLLKARQEYVLNQLEKNIVRVNKEIREKKGLEEDVLTKEMIEEAKNFELVYKAPKIEIKAPHFVFYTQKLLQQRGYNDGNSFTLPQLETGGYKIYTTLDLDFQEIAEEQVKKGVENYARKYGGENAALVALNPKNGQVLAMAGSYDYFGKATPEGCTPGVNCKFEPNVNIIDTYQSPGSSMKSHVFYMAFVNGIINAGSVLPDVPIEIGRYVPKNYEGGFVGFKSARWMLSESRNIPAIYLVDQIGVDKYISEMRKWGYILDNPAGYGPAVAVGGLDVKLIDHAQSHTVFANEGKFARHEVITKIVDRDGNVIYEHFPQPEQVADPRGIFLVNDILNGRKGGPGVSWDGRDVAGKTGTSERQMETLFATYTPEIVVVAWAGNNDNSSMRYGASGFQTTRPWASEYLKRIGGALPKTSFNRPAGITTQNSCISEDESACAEFKGDLAIAGIDVPAYIEVNKYMVCVDQEDKKARDIDIAMDKAVEKLFKFYKMPSAKFQPFLDKWLLEKEGITNFMPPTEECTIPRNPSGTENPWVVINKPTTDKLLGDKIEIDVIGYTSKGTISKIEVLFNGTLLGEKSNSNVYKDTFTIGTQTAGSHELQIKVTDSEGKIGISKVNLEVVGTITINSPATAKQGTTINIPYTYFSTSITNVELFVNGSKVSATCNATQCSWSIPVTTVGIVDVQIKAKHKGTEITSEVKQITITV
jgi:penicillin-binding protein 1A